MQLGNSAAGNFHPSDTPVSSLSVRRLNIRAAFRECCSGLGVRQRKKRCIAAIDRDRKRFAQLANPKIQLAHCWSHARREVLPFEADPRGARVLRVLQRLYRLEAVAAERQLSPPKLIAWRPRKTKPLLEALFKWLATLAIPSTFDLSKALKYILSRKQGLMRFFDDPLLSSGQQCNRTRHSWCGRRPKEPLRLTLRARHQGCGADVQFARLGRTRRPRPCRLLGGRSPSGTRRRGHPAPSRAGRRTSDDVVNLCRASPPRRRNIREGDRRPGTFELCETWFGAARVNSGVTSPSAPAVGIGTCVTTRAAIERSPAVAATRPSAGWRSSASCCCR